MTWVLPVLLAWAVLSLPGYLLLLAIRARVPLRWGWAPVVTVLITVLLSGVFRLLGIPWHPLTAALGTLVLVLITAVVHRYRSFRAAGRSDTARPRVQPGAAVWGLRVSAVVIGIAIASGLLMVASATTRMQGIDTLNTSHDAFFHHSSIAFIREDGEAFLTTALTDIYLEPTFYPVVWAALASLLPFGTVVSANGMMLALLAALPSSVAAMLATILMPQRTAGTVQRTAGTVQRAAPAAAAPVAVAAVAAGAAGSTVFLSIPAMALVMGLWPIVLGAVCLPVAVASVTRLADDPRHRLDARAVVRHAAVLLGTALAHPSMLFSLAIIAGLLLLVRGVQRVLRDDAPRRGMLQAVGALTAAVVYVIFSGVVLAGMHLTNPSWGSLGGVFWRILVDSPRIPAIGAPVWPVLMVWVLAIAGAVVAVRRGEGIGIAAGTGVVVTVLLGLATQINNPLMIALVNPWYGARERIAPLMMCLLLLLAARGVLALARTVRVRGRRLPLAPIALALLAATVIGALMAPQRLPLMGSLAYTAYGRHLAPYVTPLEREFINQSAAQLPDDAVVIADPRDGAPVYWFEGGVETVYPTLSWPQTTEQALLGQDFMRILWDDRYCEAFQRIQPTHLYRDYSENSGPGINRQASEPWRGLHEIPPWRLDLVDRYGPYALYELEFSC